MFGKEEEEINFFFALLKTIQPTVKHEESIRLLFSFSRMCVCAVKIIKKEKSQIIPSLALTRERLLTDLSILFGFPYYVFESNWLIQ